MNTLENLSQHTLEFLKERTDFSEPWCGIGFATKMEEEITKELERKKQHNEVFIELFT